jgi:putative heme-binding domain-containing protein
MVSAQNQDRTQNIPQANPLAGNPQAITAGMGMYRARCADCHGMDARGYRGPDLTQVWASGRTDDGLFRTLRNGIPGSEMPALSARTPDHEIWQLLAYLRTVAAPAPSDPPRGNAENGEKIFRAQCSACHRVNGRGGRLGPDLTRIGASRARTTLVRQVRGAVEGFRPGYAPVVLTPREGAPIHAVKKNEDLFSVQVMDTRERIQGYLKEDLREVADQKQSLMPAFEVDTITESDLDDLIAYMLTLRGAPATAPAAR